MNVKTLSTGRTALYLCAFAFIVRVAAILISPAHLWAYTVYYDVAMNVVGILTGHAETAFMITGALIGSLTVWMTWLIGRRLFGPPAGMLAAACAAIYPYFVWHDAVIQETATLTLIVAVAVYLLIQAHDSNSRLLWFSTGAVLALTVLTKANLLLFIPAALLWILFFSQGPRTQRFLFTTLGVVVLLGPWVMRTWRITGSPVLYSNGGFALWTSNHRLTFDYFPEHSIDDAHVPEWNDLTGAERDEFNAITDDPQDVAHSRWYWNKGMAFILANPGLTFERGLRKIWIAFSPRFSPAQSAAFEAVYFVSYFPLLILAMAGVLMTRARWRQLGYVYVLVLTFAAGTAVLWAHTSHRMYLEPYLMIFAAAAVMARVSGTSSPGAETAAPDKES
jgi:4-amino-4-deoxy-L-arabinose transferase-like glycosyltransferase